VQFGKGIQMFWSNVRARGTTLAESVGSAARSSISRTQTFQHQSSNVLSNRQLCSYGFTTRGSFPSSSVQNVRYYSTSQHGQSTSSRYQSYQKANDQEKVLSLTHSGLRMLGANLSPEIPPSSSSIETGWKEVQQRYPELSDFDPKHPEMNFVSLATIFNTYDPNIQMYPVIEDLDEVLIFEKFRSDPANTVTVPYSLLSTEDSLAGLQVLKEKTEPKAFILEDGCASGQHLTQLVETFNEDGVPIKAVGTDIAFYDIATGKMLVSTLGMESQCLFASAHTLHRSSPRAISGKEGQHITLAYRMIPVFNEKKIFRYMDKVSKEMKPGDLWCGSIALPQGTFYERYTEDDQLIREQSIRSIPTTFGATTIVYKPNMGATNEQLVQHFNSEYQGIGPQFDSDDLSNVMLNTYMTREQFESLAAKYGFKLATDPIEVDCHDNKRLVVMLEKI